MNSSHIITATSAESPGQNKFTCLCCRVKFETAELQRAHFKSEWHLYNLKRKVCNLEPIDLDSFIQVQAASPAPRDDDEVSLADMRLRLVDVPNKLGDRCISEKHDDGEDDDWVNIDSDELVDEEYDEKEIDELLASVVDSDTCLFCNKKNSGIKSNIRHMTNEHGFFLPEDKYLVDVEGLMEYLGFKVGAGATCLWCDKQFTSVHGVRLHMIYKGHCKIFYDQERATGEFKEFYDYSNQDHFDMKPLEELVIKRRAFERRHDQSRQLIKTDHRINYSQQSDASRALRSRNYKRFNTNRAKNILRTSLSNNQTRRDRIRMQNPI